MATLIALLSFAAAIVDHAELLTLPTPRATETHGPAGKLQGRETLLLYSIGLAVIGEGKPLLVLDSVLGHAMPPLIARLH